MQPDHHNTIVICIGNELIADDAVGFEIYCELLRTGCGARVEFCGVAGIDMLPMLNGEKKMIVVDAVQFGNTAPGTITVFPWEDLPINGSTAISAHGLGLRETIEIGTVLYPGKMPEEIYLVGIEGACFNLTREFMSEAVSRAVAPAVTTVKDLITGEMTNE